MHIVLVEDNKGDTYLVQEALDIIGFKDKLTIVEDGETALQLISEQQPPLILMDLNLPNLDGIQVTKQLRERGNISIIIMLTSSSLPFDISRAYGAGVNTYIVKVNTIWALIDNLSRIVTYWEGAQLPYDR
jgi:CheY-like chemotaxis protein